MKEDMMRSAILLFLHGVGTGDPERKWEARLSDSLVRVGYPSLEGVRVIAPRYAHALKGIDEPEKIPHITLKKPSGDTATKNRRDFERRIGALEFRLGRQNQGAGVVGGGALVDFAAATPFFAQASNYLSDEQIRAHVLNRILGKLPETGRVVLVGHSLGSVIAADLLRRLPPSLEVVGMVTVGSPLASETFATERLREELLEPPSNLNWWVSFWDWGDPVAARRGVSSAFPWMIDFAVRTNMPGPLAAHQAVEYFSHDVVAEAIGFAVFGSRSKEIARVERGVDAPLDTAESIALLALRYAHLIRERLKGDVKDRYSGALRNVQANLVQLLTTQRSESGRPLPESLASLVFDLSDPDAPSPHPHPARHLAKDEAIIPLMVIVSENIILPYEIAIPLDIQQRALEDLTAEMGLGGVFGSDIFAALKRARVELSGGAKTNWVKWGVMGAGAVALVAATGGLALAAGAGLAGAAAITSALAAFGPGGMIGGLLTAGTLATAGGGGIAFGLARSDAPADAVEAVISSQLSAEILRSQHHLPSDPWVWRNLVTMEMELRRERERLDEFSDGSALSMKELKRKVVAVGRALTYLKNSGMEPGSQADQNRDGRDDSPEPWYQRIIPGGG